MPEKTIVRSIRLEPELWRALEGLAKKDRRSVNNLIAHVLATHCDVQEAWPE